MHFKSSSPEAHRILVHEGVTAEVWDHPSVMCCSHKGRYQVFWESCKKHSPHSGPLIEVNSGVLDTSPLTPYCGHLALGVELTKLFLTIKYKVFYFFGRHILKKIYFMGNTLFESLGVLTCCSSNVFPVGLFDQFSDDACNLLHIFSLGFPVYMIF